jgi:hypothetical protein
MRHELTGMLVVVGGHSRRVGKTGFIERFLRARADERWVAVKISSHRHAADDGPLRDIVETSTPTLATQTGRFLLAGAQRALLVRAADDSLPSVRTLIDGLRAEANVIVESNRVVRQVTPDLVVFVVDPLNDDWKASSADCLARADAIVCDRAANTPRVAEAARQLASERPLFMTADSMDCWRMMRWLEAELRVRRDAAGPQVLRV